MVNLYLHSLIRPRVVVLNLLFPQIDVLLLRFSATIDGLMHRTISLIIAGIIIRRHHGRKYENICVISLTCYSLHCI
jgi:hypothetical protein